MKAINFTPENFNTDHLHAMIIGKADYQYLQTEFHLFYSRGARTWHVKAYGEDYVRVFFPTKKLLAEFKALNILFAQKNNGIVSSIN